MRPTAQESWQALIAISLLQENEQVKHSWQNVQVIWFGVAIFVFFPVWYWMKHEYQIIAILTW